MKTQWILLLRLTVLVAGLILVIQAIKYLESDQAKSGAFVKFFAAPQVPPPPSTEALPLPLREVIESEERQAKIKTSRD